MCAWIGVNDTGKGQRWECCMRDVRRVDEVNGTLREQEKGTVVRLALTLDKDRPLVSNGEGISTDFGNLICAET